MSVNSVMPKVVYDRLNHNAIAPTSMCLWLADQSVLYPYFWFFNEQFEMTLKEFSIALGFRKRCMLDPSSLAKKHRYDQNS